MRRLKLIDKFMPEGAAELAAKIEAEKQKGSDAYAAIERLEDERRGAESFEQARALDVKIARLRFDIGRIDVLLPELEERLADAQWQEREVAFDKHKRLLMAAARKAITAIEAAARANAEIVQARHNASAELGNHVAVLPLQYYGGILMPDLVAVWRRHTEAQLAQMEGAELTRPTKPRPPGASQAPSGDRMVLVEAAPPPMADPPAKAAQPAPVPPEQPPAAPAPRSAKRQNGPPGPGQRQIKFLRGGLFTLPGGGTAVAGDCVNLTEADALQIVRTGSADYVAALEPVVGDGAVMIRSSELLGVRP